MKPRKVAILGGTFNPPTKAHIEIAQYVLDNTDTEEVWLTPCNDHRQKSVSISPAHRLEMCNIAIRNSPNIYVCSYEINQKLDGAAFTCVSELKELWGDAIDFHYIIGMDNVNSFDSWVKSEELKKLVKFIVVSRDSVENSGEVWYRLPPHQFFSAGDKIRGGSSTQARNLVVSNNRDFWGSMDEELDFLVDKDVIEYIYKNGLYRSQMDEKRKPQ